MPKECEELVEILDEKYWYRLDAGQCTSCFAKNALKETHNYVLKIGAISYTVPIGDIYAVIAVKLNLKDLRPF